MGLREDTAKSRRRQHYLGLGLIGVVVAGVFLVYLPNRAQYRNVQEKIASVEADAAANAQRVTALPKLIADVKELRAQVDRYKPLLGRTDIERAQDEISKIKESTKVSNYSFKTFAPVARPICIEQPLEISFTSDFVDAMSLIQRLESMNRITRMRELSIRSSDGSGRNNRGVVNVRMRVSLFFADGMQ